MELAFHYFLTTTKERRDSDSGDVSANAPVAIDETHLHRKRGSGQFASRECPIGRWRHVCRSGEWLQLKLRLVLRRHGAVGIATLEVVALPSLFLCGGLLLLEVLEKA